MHDAAAASHRKAALLHEGTDDRIGCVVSELALKQSDFALEVSADAAHERSPSNDAE